jgi:hypothetical protein
VDLTYDNPASRLLNILVDGKKIAADKPCRGAWQQLLGVEEEALLMSRLGKVMELPHQIIALLQEHYPGRTASWQHWNTQVSAGFMQQNLNGQWNTFIGLIDAHSMTYLSMSADLLANRDQVQTIAQDQAEELRRELQEILAEVLKSDLERSLIIYVSRYLRMLITSIDEYKITGALPILDAVDAAVGHTAVDPKYKDFLTSSSIGGRIVTALAATANLVTVVVGLPQLPAGVAAAKHLLGVG